MGGGVPRSGGGADESTSGWSSAVDIADTAGASTSGIDAGGQDRGRDSVDPRPADPIKEQAGEERDIWPAEVVYRCLAGHLRSYVSFTERTAKTPASLMRKGTAWLVRNKDHLGQLEDEGRSTALLQQVVVDVLRPTSEELGLAAFYGDRVRMDEVAVANAAATDMADVRIRVGPGWRWLSGGLIATGAGLAGLGCRKIGVAMAVTGAVTGLVTEFARAQPTLSHWWRRTWALPTAPSAEAIVPSA